MKAKSTLRSLVVLAVLVVLCGGREARGASYEVYEVSTANGASIELIRYNTPGGGRETPVLMVPGMFENHRVFDYDVDRSLARYLCARGWDIWILNLRTHDADGDPGWWWENEENMDKYWDFDEAYLDDVVAAIQDIKEQTGQSVVFLGHSMGGYLAYAYAQLKNQADLAGIITIGSAGKASAMDPVVKFMRTFYGLEWWGHVYVASWAPYNFDSNNIEFMREAVRSEVFYEEVTPREVQDGYIATLDDEPAGVVVDMWYGFDEDWKDGHWWDPQTGYDYTANLDLITVPFLAIAGDKDVSDKPEDVWAAYDGVSSIDKTYEIYEDYGHVDLLVGDPAPDEIFPYIADWLDVRFD